MAGTQQAQHEKGDRINWCCHPLTNKAYVFSYLSIAAKNQFLISRIDQSLNPLQFRIKAVTLTLSFFVSKQLPAADLFI